MTLLLSAERLAAAASGLCIRVAELESASYERVTARFKKIKIGNQLKLIFRLTLRQTLAL